MSLIRFPLPSQLFVYSSIYGAVSLLGAADGAGRPLALRVEATLLIFAPPVLSLAGHHWNRLPIEDHVPGRPNSEEATLVISNSCTFMRSCLFLSGQ